MNPARRIDDDLRTDFLALDAVLRVRADADDARAFHQDVANVTC
jgi:hypothetical protein